MFHFHSHEVRAPSPPNGGVLSWHLALKHSSFPPKCGSPGRVVSEFLYPTAKGLVLLPRRWVVERMFAWFGRNRRLAKSFEKTIENAEPWLLIANIQLLARRAFVPHALSLPTCRNLWRKTTA